MRADQLDAFDGLPFDKGLDQVAIDLDPVLDGDLHDPHPDSRAAGLLELGEALVQGVGPDRVPVKFD